MGLNCLLTSLFLAGAATAFAGAADQTNTTLESASPAIGGEARLLYHLGPGDEIRVQQPNAEELDGSSARVDDRGFVNLPLAGRLQVGGLTVEELEARLATSLSKLLLNPQPVVSITEYRSQPVSVLGAVNTPGVIQLQGRKTLVEMLSMAGGLSKDAGTEVQVTRRLSYGRLPVTSASEDASHEFSMAKIDVTALLKGSNPANNIIVLPQDIISVPRAEQIYVTGDVRKPGGFPISGGGGISVLQAVSLAEGLNTTASAKNAKIFRPDEDGGVKPGKSEISVDLNAILSGKSSDIVLQPRDILFIPDSKSKKAGVRAAEAAIQAATGIVIWGRL